MSLVLVSLGVSAAAFLTAAGSVVVQFRRLRRMEAQTRSGAYLQIERMTFDLAKVFLERPHLRPFFYDGVASAADGEDAERVRIVAAMVADFAEFVFEQEKHLDPESIRGWIAWTKYVAGKSPALQAHLQEHLDWYPKAARRLALLPSPAE